MAVRSREPLRAGRTDALRLIDGLGDGLPNVIIEDFAGHWLLSTAEDREPPPWMLRWLEGRGMPCYHKRLALRRKDSSPEWLCGERVNGAFQILEHGVAFEVSFSSGYSQGIFLDQRDNRAEVRARSAAGARVLNTFAYTGAFSVCAALGGAETTTLDLSQPYLDWARRNMSLNGIDTEAHHFCRGDAFHWLRRFARQGRSFDGIILDPPTFSRDDKGRVFRVERDFGGLAELAAGVLAPGGWMLCCTNLRKMTSAAFERQLLEKTGGRFRASRRPMPGDFTDQPYLKSVWLDG